MTQPVNNIQCYFEIKKIMLIIIGNYNSTELAMLCGQYEPMTIVSLDNTLLLDLNTIAELFPERRFFNFTFSECKHFMIYQLHPVKQGMKTFCDDGLNVDLKCLCLLIVFHE